MEKPTGTDIRRYLIIVAFWVVLIVATSSGGSRLTNDVESNSEFIDEDTESGRGSLLIEERFNSSDPIIHIVVLKLDEGSSMRLDDGNWIRFNLALTLYLNASFFQLGYSQILSTGWFNFIASITLDQNVSSEFYNIAQSLVSEDGDSALINLISELYDFETQQDDLREHVHLLRDAVAEPMTVVQFGLAFLNFTANELPNSEELEKLSIYVTGQVANFVDLLEVSEQTFSDSEVIAVIFILIILFLVFRSPLGIFIPILGMIAALFPTYMTVYLFGRMRIVGVSDFLPSTIAMIGIAVAVDYNLFSLVRFREEFRSRRAKHESEGTWTSENIKIAQIESAKRMNATAGQAVMFSGFTVIIGFVSLMLIGSSFTSGVAIGVSIVVIYSIISTRTLTPAFLSIFGRYLDWPNILSRANQDVESQRDEVNHAKGEKNKIWVRWSKFVMRYPIIFLIIGLLTLAPFIIYSTQTELSFDSLKNLPPGTESRNGFEVVFTDFNLGETQPYQVIVDGGNTPNSVLDESIFSGLVEIAQWALEDGRGFQGLASLNMEINSSNGQLNVRDLTTVQLLMNFDWFKASTQKFINYDNGNNILILELYANIDSGTAEAWALAEALREKSHDVFDDNSVVKDVYVSGFSALFNDTSDNMYEKLPLMILFAVVLIYIALLILFRSIILPAKAILTIAGSILFGLGTLVYVFQHGHFEHVQFFGYTLWEHEQTSGLMFIMPIFIFTTILGLGMDYSIFIISRIKEEYDKGTPISDSVGIGLSKTAGVVTSAALIMTTTFMVFALSPLMVLKTMGLALSVGIIIDATISRIIILPAAMKLAGKWNWYLPKWLDKILPRVELEH